VDRGTGTKNKRSHGYPENIMGTGSEAAIPRSALP